MVGGGGHAAARRQLDRHGLGLVVRLVLVLLEHVGVLGLRGGGVAGGVGGLAALHRVLGLAYRACRVGLGRAV